MNYTRLLILATLSVASLAHAGKKQDILAELQCKVIDKNHDKTKVQLSGTYQTLTIGNKKFSLKGMEEKSGYVELKAEGKSDNLKLRLTPDYRHITIKTSNGKLIGKCKDTLSASSSDVDDSEHDYFDLFPLQGD